MTSDRLQQCGSRYVPGILSFFSNPVEGSWWRHEGLGNDPSNPFQSARAQCRSETSHWLSTTCATPHYTALGTCWLKWIWRMRRRQAPLVKGIHIGWHCLCHCPGLILIRTDRSDIYRVKVALGERGFTERQMLRSSYMMCHAVPRDCYPKLQWLNLCFWCPAIQCDCHECLTSWPEVGNHKGVLQTGSMYISACR